FVAPLFSPSSELNADTSFEYEEITEAQDALESMQSAKNLRKLAADRMSAFRQRILELQASGEVAKVKFSTSILEGVPEEVILSYCSETPPMLVVMATRGIEKKEEELIGSVTAEVLDSCRVPVLTVPDNHHFVEIRNLKRLMVFCNLDQHDVIAVDVLMRMFDYPECNVILVPAVEKRKSISVRRMEELCRFFNENFPSAKFEERFPDSKDYRKEIDTIINKEKIEMMIVPNKRTNVFTRIFHPTIAHRFLFERDMLMLALPV
ncbi:MAG: universal stress protein, partial [Muribaculaceae bacterium]|nr:universal stress protein [Muribaculaceae bacterium]